MTDTILMTLPAGLTDLPGEIALIRAIAKLAPQLDRIVQGVGVDTAQKLLDWLGSNVDGIATDTVFKGLGLDGLLGELQAMKGRIAALAPNAALLLKPVGDFVETADANATAAKALPAGWIDGTDPGMIRWTPTATIAAPPRTTATLSLALDAALEFEAGALWPFASDLVAPGLLRISATGKLRADAGATLPYQFVTVGGQADTEVACGIHFFFRQGDPSRLYALALADALEQLPDPFDPQAVWNACTRGNLAGLILTFDGAARVGIEVALGKDVDVPDLISGKIAATISADLSRRADFQLSFRSLGDGNQTPRKLLATLSRETEAASRWAAGVDVTLDTARLAARVKDIVANGLDKWDAALANVKPFLLPGDWLRNSAGADLNAAVGRLIADPGLAAVLTHDVGLLVGKPVAGSALGDELSKRLTDAIDKVAGTATAAIDEFAGTATGAITQKIAMIADLLKLALPGLAGPAAAAPLRDAITDALRIYASQVKALGDKLIVDPGAGNIEKALDDIGVKVAGGVTNANDALAGVRRLIDKYDSFLRQVVDKTNKAIATKVTAQFAYEEKRMSGAEYEITGLFTAIDGPAGDLFRGLVLGRLAAIEQAFTKGAVPGFELCDSSSIRRFAQGVDTLGYAIVLLGVEIAGGDILTGKAEIWHSADSADVRITDEGGFKRWRKAWGEERSLTFTSTQILLIARAQAARVSATLSLVASHGDSDLKLGEVRGFLDRLVDAGVVAAARRDAAVTTFNGWATTRGDNQKVGGTIVVTLTLDASGVAALIDGGRTVITDINGAGAQHLFRLAVAAMRSTADWADGSFQNDVKLCREQGSLSAIAARVPDPTEFLFAVHNVLPKDPSGPRAQPLTQFNSVRDHAAAAMAFITLLQKSAAIFDSPGATPTWTEQDYSRADQDLAGASAIWLRLNGFFLLPFNKDMHRRTVAFFLAIACLARNVEPGSAQPAFDDMISLTLQKSGDEKVTSL